MTYRDLLNICSTAIAMTCIAVLVGRALGTTRIDSAQYFIIALGFRIISVIREKRT